VTVDVNRGSLPHKISMAKEFTHYLGSISRTITPCTIYPNFFPTVFTVTTSRSHGESSCLLGLEFRLIGELCVTKFGMGSAKRDDTPSSGSRNGTPKS